jgi:hypothetical protein
MTLVYSDLDDETRVGLVSVPLNRVELPLTILGFAFLREVDSMVFGVHVVLPSHSEGAFMDWNSTLAFHFGYQSGQSGGLEVLSN